jgi:hypothetical protein
MTYEVSVDGRDDPEGKGASYIGVGGTEAYHTALAAATYMLERGLELFSKKECDDGSWWVDLTVGGDRSTRTRGLGANLAEAVEDCFAKMGQGGLRWKLYKLERRIILLGLAMGLPLVDAKVKAAVKKGEMCSHGVRKDGGRCKKCGV